MACGFRHAAPLHDREQHMQIAQLEAASDAIFPLHVCHSQNPMELSEDPALFLSHDRQRFQSRSISASGYPAGGPPGGLSMSHIIRRAVINRRGVLGGALVSLAA